MAADIAEENLRTSLSPDFGILELGKIGLEEVTDSNSGTLERDTTNDKDNQHQERESSCNIGGFSSALDSLKDAAENNEPKNDESSDNRRTKGSHVAKVVSDLKHLARPILGFGEHYSAVAIFWLHEFIVLDGCRAAFRIPGISTCTPWYFTAENKFYYLKMIFLRENILESFKVLTSLI